MALLFSLADYHRGLASVRAMLAEVETIYQELDATLARCDSSEPCRACGDCCDFEAFGHCLYITTPELLFFALHLDTSLLPMTGGVCPYRVEGRCSAYSIRFAGCRIFQCKGNAAMQSDLTETTLTQLKSLCTQHNVPYRYMDLKTALNSD